MARNSVIIGASSGIGRELAKKLYIAGDNIIITARNKNNLEELKSEILKIANIDHKKQKIFICDFDCSDEIAFEKYFKKITKEFKEINLAIFAAGIYEPSKFKDFDLAVAKKTLDVNLNGFLVFLKFFGDKMIKQKSGKIAAIASVAGYRGLPQSFAYGASKAAMINLCEGIYHELKSYNVDICVVNPGFVESRLTSKNNFEMPFIISPQKAADEIIKGLKQNRFEIHFPKKFTFILKILRLVHVNIFLKLVKKYIYPKYE